MSRSKAQTQFELIDPALEARKWRHPNLRFEITSARIVILAGKCRRQTAGHTDYLLRRPILGTGEPISLASFDAKRDRFPTVYGSPQSNGYRAGQLSSNPFDCGFNGHLLVEFNEPNTLTSVGKPLSEFPVAPATATKRHRSQP